VTETFTKTSRLPFPAEDVFAWHARPGAFERLNPPWNPATIIRQSGGIDNGSRMEIRVPVGPFKMRWIAEHRHCIPGRQFEDVQIVGPFAEWEHRHTITPTGPSTCELRDDIRYRPPLGTAGRFFAGRSIRRELERVFDYRHRMTRDDLQTHANYSKDHPMKILITGSSGLIGSKLSPALTTGGHDVVSLVRPQTGTAASSPQDASIEWNPAEKTIDRGRLEGFDAVVHLAGENIGGKRWSEKQKARIRNSRVEGTRFLRDTLAGLNTPPRVFVCASAIGYYGDRGDERLDESSPPGDGFLPQVCQEWEAAAAGSQDDGIRVVHTRFGVVLSPEGGALKQMLFPFKACVGGVIGSGKQYWSWVGIDDVVGAILHVLTTNELDGPVNVTAPHPVTNREFTKTLGRVLRRPTVFPMPAFAARLLLGEMADELLLADARVVPHKLQETGYKFRFPELELALRHVLGRA